MQRRSDVEYIPFLIPARGRVYDIFGVGAAVGGAAQAAGSLGAAAIQANAADYAANLTSQAEENSLAFTQKQYDTTQSNAAPYLAGGATALGEIEAGTGPGGSLITPYQPYNAPAPFVAPTAVNDSNDPGYEFALAQGNLALQRGAAASGGAVTGGTLEAEQKFGQQEGAQQYQQVYANQLNAYNTNASTGLASYNANANNYYTGQANNYNRLANLVGVGQSANGQVANAGAAAAGTTASAATAGANNTGNYLTQGANAAGAGIVGAGSAITNGINTYQNGQLLASINRSPAAGVSDDWGASTPSQVNYDPDAQ